MAGVPHELSSHLASLPADRGMRQAAALDWGLVQIADEAIDAIGIDNIIAAVLSAYDKYCIPLDIPFIPDNLEPAFDDSAKFFIAATIRGFHAHIHREKPAGKMMAAAPRTWIGEAA